MADLEKLHEIIAKTSSKSYKADLSRYIYEQLTNKTKTAYQLSDELGLQPDFIYKKKYAYEVKLIRAEKQLKEVEKNWPNLRLSEHGSR